MKKAVHLLATGLGTGYIKPAPGTWGTLLGVILMVILPISFPIIIGSILFGIYICQEGEKILCEHDSPKIVFDEIVGVWIALWNIPLAYFPIAFLFFRFFDIKKFYPINLLQRLPGGWGIMMDDLAAGVITRIIIILITRF